MAETKEEQFKKLTETPVEKLIIRLAVPTTISMLVTSIYNMADTYFVSTMGNSASGAVGVVFALMAIIQAFGFMCGQGAGSILSRRLGEGKIEEARHTATIGFSLAAAIGLVIALVGLLRTEELVTILGSTPTILPYASTYARYILIAAPAMTCSCLLNNSLRYEAKAVFAMIGLVTGNVLNLLLDYVLIIKCGMGIEGAGIATMVAQYVSVFILYLPFLRKQVQTRISPRYFSFDYREALDIVGVGFPSLLRQGLAGLSTLTLNWCAGPFGDAAIAAMSISARCMNFFFSVTIGVGQGFQPVSAFNYGARRYSRVKKALRFMIVFSSALMAVTCVIGMVFAEPIVTFFRDDPEVVAIGTKALRISAVALVLLPMSTGANMMCQSIGKKLEASLMASTRCGLFYIPLIIILSKAFGLAGIECTQLCADVLAVLVSIPVMLRVTRQFPADGEE